MERIEIGERLIIAIHGLSHEGEGVGYGPGRYALFIPAALPGEEVEIELIERGARFGRGRLIAIRHSSRDRVEPVCPLFGRCGGCQLMHLSDEGQLRAKRQRVVDALQRIGGVKEAQVAECVASPHPLGYRNKIQLPVRQGDRGRMEIGLFATGSHQLVEVERCAIHSPLGERVYQRTRQLLVESGLEPYAPREASEARGQLRHLLIRSSLRSGQAMVVLVTHGEGSREELQSLAARLMEEEPSLVAIFQNVQTSLGSYALGKDYWLLAGEEKMEEQLSKLTLQLSPNSFFQVNSLQAEQLYAKAIELAQISGGERVVDGYCGIGVLSLLLARQGADVLGVELVEEAILDARKNQQLNGVERVEFLCAKVEEVMPELAGIDVVVLNPPRKGCDRGLLERLAQLAPERVVYISCDPATLARDLALLQRRSYRIHQVFPFDMFPQTAHVESVVLAERLR